MEPEPFLEIEKDFCKQFFDEKIQIIKNHRKKLIKISSYQNLIDNQIISNAIILRMSAFFQFEDKMKIFLKKHVATPGAYFFQETVGYYLQLFFDWKKNNFNVEIEKGIRITNDQRKIKILKPDLSVWRDKKLQAIIECKLQLGYSRNEWEEKYIKKKNVYLSEYPEIKTFFLVFTKENWSGFENHQLEEKEYFTLSKTWPRSIEEPREILNPIETLFKKIVENKNY
ncbi:MAG: hypothetical protein HeimC3_53730 [Candidatus Heimdallarchaeota archaeon LC_3]|nr:MAG: hypothetical protein HeimC3_53730 [Candidatus Heimdallarchaeota archaeon LC_3]